MMTPTPLSRRERLSKGMAAQARSRSRKRRTRAGKGRSARRSNRLFRLRRWARAEAEFRKVLELSPATTMRITARPLPREAGQGGEPTASTSSPLAATGSRRYPPGAGLVRARRGSRVTSARVRVNDEVVGESGQPVRPPRRSEGDTGRRPCASPARWRGPGSSRTTRASSTSSPGDGRRCARGQPVHADRGHREGIAGLLGRCRPRAC